MQYDICSRHCPNTTFFPLDVLDEIWDLIESVSEGFLTYSSISIFKITMYMIFDIIIRLKLSTNFDRCAILKVLNCLTKNFEPCWVYS